MKEHRKIRCMRGVDAGKVFTLIRYSGAYVEYKKRNHVFIGMAADFELVHGPD